ncbi:MAG TPA: transposase [Aggregatilineaceae bacterium]|nr:transposase [Aggregatilineaceae bacterium]
MPPRHLHLLACGLLLPSETLLTVYRVRWQIELCFKLCKSHFRLAVIGPWRRQRLLCQLYARLIGVTLFRWLIVPWRLLAERELSPVKVFPLVRRPALPLLRTLSADGVNLVDILAEVDNDFLRYALRTPRTKSPSTFSLFEQLQHRVAWLNAYRGISRSVKIQKKAQSKTGPLNFLLASKRV